MKLLLTCAGIRNPSIHAALLDLLGKPIADCHALLIPTALYGHPQGSPAGAWRFVNGRSGCPMGELGWKSLGVLELSVLDSLPRARWMAWVQAADVLLVEGGDALFLAYWMRRSGVADVLASFPDKVWVGLSAGSMAMAPQVGDEFIEMRPPLTGADVALGVVDFAIFPHLDHPGFDENTMACAETWAARIGCPGYAIDDQTAIKVVDGRAEVVSEGQWRHFVR